MRLQGTNQAPAWGAKCESKGPVHGSCEAAWVRDAYNMQILRVQLQANCACNSMVLIKQVQSRAGMGRKMRKQGPCAWIMQGSVGP